MNLVPSILLWVAASIGSYYLGLLAAPFFKNHHHGKSGQVSWPEPRSSLPTFRTSEVSDTARIQQQQQQQQVLDEVFVHPALLTHLSDSSPKLVVAVVSPSSEGLLEEIERHKTIQETFVATSPSDEQETIRLLKQNQNQKLHVVLIDDDDNYVNDESSSSSSSPLSKATEWQSLLQPHDGILVLRLADPNDLITRVHELGDAGFDQVTDYSIRLGNTKRRQHYLIAFTHSIAVWHLSEALWNLRIRQRMMEVPQFFLDSSAMITMEYPSKQSAMSYCPESPDCDSPHYGFDPTATNLPKESLYVSKSTAGENAGRGVFVSTDVPVNSYISLEVMVHPVRPHWTATDILLYFDDMEHPIYAHAQAPLFSYLDGYGYFTVPWDEGTLQYIVESGVLTFVNHGCNGSFNMGPLTPFTEVTVDLENLPKGVFTNDERFVYNPVKDRGVSLEQVIQTNNRALRAGEELFDNYILFGGAAYFEKNVETLRDECSGVVGFVEQLQNKATGKATKGDDVDDDTAKTTTISFEDDDNVTTKDDSSSSSCENVDIVLEE